MTNKILLLPLFFLCTFIQLKGQSLNALQQKINTILADKDAIVGVSIIGPNPNQTLAINGDAHLPMQSVYKLHLALAVLDQVDKGILSLDDKISIDKKNINTYTNLWSPIRKKYPNGTVLTLADIIKYTVAVSDNLGCDLLFELIGGTEVVQSYFHKIGVKNIAIVSNEVVMQAEWKNQYDNWTTPNAANKVLQLFFKNENNLLTTESYNFILKVLKGTITGKKSIKGQLPKDAIVAHKTGHSGKNNQGLTAALNDIGIVFLPSGKHFYLSIMVSNSKEDSNVNSKIIADIAKLTWDYFEKN